MPSKVTKLAAGTVWSSPALAVGASLTSATSSRKRTSAEAGGSPSSVAVTTRVSTLGVSPSSGVPDSNRVAVSNSSHAGRSATMASREATPTEYSSRSSSGSVNGGTARVKGTSSVATCGGICGGTGGRFGATSTVRVNAADVVCRSSDTETTISCSATSAGSGVPLNVLVSVSNRSHLGSGFKPCP